MEKIYAVAVKREATDYILINAYSEQEAMERANALILGGTYALTLGEDGEDLEATGAEESKASNTDEENDLQANNDAWVEYMSEDNASI